MSSRAPFKSRPDRSSCLTEIGTCIVEAETTTFAQAETIRILSRTGFDTTEALGALWDGMDELAMLREVRRTLEM
ncbi:hypothetical protein G3T14_19300 [Methylobacterium sp. BTF04]|uniref:hypothetical protein n=1 Tax=Methylobacterium sp. BTF04 TaxID=2708300 RepID=UPI0013D15C1D|nr:hypothetical protein [Methylobacterium sp. BTF04]NEU14256.1 hypothetical protein [Methylobacterium sp. BTF04]